MGSAGPFMKCVIFYEFFKSNRTKKKLNSSTITVNIITPVNNFVMNGGFSNILDVHLLIN